MGRDSRNAEEYQFPLFHSVVNLVRAFSPAIFLQKVIIQALSHDSTTQKTLLHRPFNTPQPTIAVHFVRNN